MADLISKFSKKAKGLNKKMILPEAEDERILKAAAASAEKKIIKPILVGRRRKIEEKIKKLGLKFKNHQFIEPEKSERFNQLAKFYAKIKKTKLNTAKLIIKDPLFFSALYLKKGYAEAMIGGTVYTSGQFIAVSKEIIGLQKNISVPSSIFIMDIPNYKGGVNGRLIYADASVNPDPKAEQLADIAVISGLSAKNLLGWQPKIALLSFSTKGSSSHPAVEKIIKAVQLARKKQKNLLIDGEFQADTALKASTAKRKIKGSIGSVAGKANVLIFPDLNSGNISYKLTQILANAKAYGPFLQGFQKPLSDLSRGADVDDIIGVMSILSYWAEQQK